MTIQSKIDRVALSLGVTAPNLSNPLPSIGERALVGGNMKAIKDRLLADRNAAKRFARELVDQATRADRDLSAEEREVFDAVTKSIDAVNDSLDEVQSSALDRVIGSASGRHGHRIPEDPRALRVLAPNESFADYLGASRMPQAHDAPSLGDIVLGQIGFGPGIQAAQTIGTGSAGGLMVPDLLAAQLIDLARNQSRVVQAGASTVPMAGPVVTYARWDEDPTAGWKGSEESEFDESNARLTQVTLRANMLGVIVNMSIELAEDAAGFSAALNNALASALGLELDRTALYGSGVAQPLGLSEVAGTNGITLGAPLTSFTPLSQAVQACWDVNVDPGAFILAPRTRGTIDRLVDTTGQPLRAPQSVTERQLLATNQVPINLGAAGDESEIFTGNWAELLIGIRTNITIEASRVGDGTAWKKGQISVRAYMRADALPVRPDHFSVVREVMPDA